MKSYKIAVIAGDGIGPEVLAEGIKVMNRVAELDGNFKFEFTHFPWGCEYYLKHGKMMDDDGLEQLKKFDAIYLGFDQTSTMIVRPLFPEGSSKPFNCFQ